MQYNSIKGKTMNSEIRYDLYRSQIKSINSDIAETVIYKNWVQLSCGDKWNVQSEPVKGMDGRYHYIYISVYDDDSFYIGKHSSDKPNDEDYHGSGKEVRRRDSEGKRPNTTPLAYFPTEDMAFSAEKMVVGSRMIEESSEKKVLNQVGGGRYPSYRRPGVKRCFTFADLKLKPGDMLTLLYNKGIVCYVKDEGYLVTHNGRVTGLTKLATKYAPSGVEIKNPLYCWEYNGKLLSTIRDELYPKEK